MRVGFLISEYLPSLGGAQICIHNVALELRKRNDQLVVVTTTQDKTLQDYGYEIVRISKLYIKLLRFPSIGKLLLQLKLNSLHKKYKLDVWQVVVGYPLGVFSIDFFKLYNIPSVLRCCGEDIQLMEGEVPYGYRQSTCVDKLIRKNYPKFDALIALTDSVAHEYKKLDIPDEKIHIIPNGVNLKRFARSIGKEEIKRKLGLTGKTVLLTVGRNHPKKGYNLISAILQLVSERHHDIIWVIIGKDCNNENINVDKDVRMYLMLIDEISLAQDASDREIPSQLLIDYYHAADVFVFPSFIETFGMVLVEALAAGLPVITSNVPGCRDVIEDGYNGLLADAGNCDMFVEKILDLLNDEILYNQICSNISDNIKKYDWPLVADRYEELYENLIEKRNVFKSG